MAIWVKYEGKYEKQFYDIELIDGEVIEHLWPNAGYFHGDGTTVNGDSVKYFRVSKRQTA